MTDPFEKFCEDKEREKAKDFDSLFTALEGKEFSQKWISVIYSLRRFYKKRGFLSDKQVELLEKFAQPRYENMYFDDEYDDEDDMHWRADIPNY